MWRKISKDVIQHCAVFDIFVDCSFDLLYSTSKGTLCVVVGGKLLFLYAVE